MLNQKWSNKCVLFSCFEEEDQMEDCRFSFVTFRQSSGMLNYTLTVNSRLASFGVSFSLCPCLFLGEKTDYKKKNVGKNKRKIVSTLRSGRVCATATRSCYSHTV